MLLAFYSEKGRWMILRKGLTILGLLFIILTVSCEFLLPAMATGLLQTKLVDKTSAQDVSLDMHSSPAFMLVLGRIDTLSADMRHVKIGHAYLDSLQVEGEDIDVNLAKYLTDGVVRVRSAERLDLAGTMDNENMQAMIERKVDKLQNVRVHIEPDGIDVTADTKVLGRPAAVTMQGNIIVEEGALYFRASQVNVDTPLLGRAKFGDTFGNIPLARPENLPFHMVFDRVEQRSGTVLVTAKLQ